MGWFRPRPGRTYLAGAPVLVAHRGGSRLAPENTLPAFRSALEDWGADMLEMDVRLTADGEVVVIHDATVDRTTDGEGRVDELTLDQLRSLDAGSRFQDEEGAFVWRDRDVRIPTFTEVLDACPGVWINVEAKDERVARPLVDLVLAREESHRVLIAAEAEENRSEVREYPGPWGASARDCKRFWVAYRLGLWAPDADIFQVPEFWDGRRVLTPEVVRAAHRWNIPVHVWTVDDPDDMRRLLSWGVDGIQTDRPDLLARLLTEEHGRPPPPVDVRAASTA